MTARVRREPPRFRRAVVGRTEQLGPRSVRVTLAGPELEGFAITEPAASVRLLLPSPGTLEVPAWDGNEFRLADGRRPTIRTLTPRRADRSGGRARRPTSFLLAGDETALPAIGQLLETLPADRPVEVHVEVAQPGGRRSLPGHPLARVHWHDLAAGATPGDAFVAAVAAPVEPGTRVWVAGEAAAVQRVRCDLFERRGVPRRQASVRGYWKHGRAGDGEP